MKMWTWLREDSPLSSRKLSFQGAGCPRNKEFWCNVLSIVLEAWALCDEEEGISQAAWAWSVAGGLSQGELLRGGSPDFKNVCLRQKHTNLVCFLHPNWSLLNSKEHLRTIFKENMPTMHILFRNFKFNGQISNENQCKRKREFTETSGSGRLASENSSDVPAPPSAVACLCMLASFVPIASRTYYLQP